MRAGLATWKPKDAGLKCVPAGQNPVGSENGVYHAMAKYVFFPHLPGEGC